MTESIYTAFLASILRSVLLIGGAWLVQRGMVEDGLMKEVAAGLALVIVTQGWSLVRIYSRRILEKWLVILGLEADPATAPEVIMAEAKARVRDGMKP